MGKVAMIATTAFTNQQINTIVPMNNGIDPDFIYYSLSTRRKELQNLGSAGTRTPILNKSGFENIEINLPPLPIQSTIASILCAYDDLIENNTRRIAILEEAAQLLYREWFVKFRFPGHKQVKMVESELGIIPDGWTAKKLGEVVEFAYGKALKADNRNSGEIPVYGSSGVVGYHDELLVKAPGIIVGRKGNVGSIFWSDTNFYPIDTVFYVRSAISLYYLYYNLCQQSFINSDSAVPGLSRHQAYSLPFLEPSKTVLDQFEVFIKPFFNGKANLEQRNAVLRIIRDRLLFKLISGEIDVSSWVGKDGEAARELAEIAVQMDSHPWRVAEATGSIEPIDKAAMEWDSLWG